MGRTDRWMWMKYGTDERCIYSYLDSEGLKSGRSTSRRVALVPKVSRKPSAKGGHIKWPPSVVIMCDQYLIVIDCEKVVLRFGGLVKNNYLCHRLSMDYYLKQSIRATIHDALEINHLWSVMPKI